MKEYPEIQGPNKAPNLPCIAFHKYDGSNIRAEWSRKNKWFKFGTRHRLLDEKDAEFGSFIPLFKNSIADDIEKIFLTDKIFKDSQIITVFFEFFGENSFAGWHNPNDKKEIVIIDVNINKKGFISPRNFVKIFKTLRIAEVVYEGNFNESFIKDVIDGKYPVIEGVVAKGTIPNKKPPHDLWMAKCKTRSWMDRLKLKAQEETSLQSVLVDNIKEQILI